MNGVLMVTVAVVLLLAGAAYLFLRGGEQDTEEVVEYLRCPGCNQKLRYSSGNAGRAVMCPRCKQSLLLPALSNAWTSR